MQITELVRKEEAALGDALATDVPHEILLFC